MKIQTINPLLITVPKELNYHIEQGKYRARIRKTVRVSRPTANGCTDSLRIIVEVEVPGKEQVMNLANAEYPLHLNHGSELRNVLTRLLGKQVFAELSGQEMDLQILIGREVDVEIEHVTTSKRDQYEYPLVKVRDIQLPSTLVKTNLDETETGATKGELTAK